MPEIKIIGNNGNKVKDVDLGLVVHFNDIYSDIERKPLGAMERRLGVVMRHLSLCSVFEWLSCMNV